MAVLIFLFSSSKVSRIWYRFCKFERESTRSAKFSSILSFAGLLAERCRRPCCGEMFTQVKPGVYVGLRFRLLKRNRFSKKIETFVSSWLRLTTQGCYVFILRGWVHNFEVLSLPLKRYCRNFLVKDIRFRMIPFRNLILVQILLRCYSGGTYLHIRTIRICRARFSIYISPFPRTITLRVQQSSF